MLKAVITIAILIIGALLVVLAVGATVSTLRQPQESAIEPSAAPETPLTEEGKAFIERMGPSATPEELVAEMVREVRADIDNFETENSYGRYVGIEGSGRVLTYRIEAYQLEGVQYTRANLTSFLQRVLCGDEEMRYMLRAGVEVVSIYSFENSSETYAISTTEDDCRAIGL